jgi:hypothetical protein
MRPSCPRQWLVGKFFKVVPVGSTKYALFQIPNYWLHSYLQVICETMHSCTR